MPITGLDYETHMEGVAQKITASRHAGSVGVLIDRTSSHDEVIGSCWLIDQDKVATCAHNVILFAENLEAIKIRFPASGEERGVSRALFHPRFSRAATAQMAHQAMTDYLPTVPLQKNNAVVLVTTPTLPDLSNSSIATVIARLTAPAQSLEQGMGGSLSELDLAMVLQTITNARKEGILVITDDRNRTLARLFCQDGKVLHAQYDTLLNETALFQIVESQIDGNFHFRSAKNPDWLHRRPINRSTEMLLLESHRRIDEITKLKEELGGDEGLWLRIYPNLNTEAFNPEEAERARALWPVLDGSTPANQLWRLCGLDDYSVFQGLVDLRRSMQIDDQLRFKPQFNHKPLSIPCAVQVPLKPYDEIESLIVDQYSGRPLVRKGSLLGSLREQDPHHLVHNLVLPPEAAGSPMFKDGQVIGMHCGSLPPDPDTSDGTHLQQMLWVDVVLQCLAQAGEPELVRKLSQSSLDLPKLEAGATPPTPGCREVARVNCPKCGASHLESSRFCKTCGQKLILEFEVKKKSAGFINPTLVLIGLIAVVAAATLAMFAAAPRANFISSEYVTKPALPWAVISGKYNDPTKHAITYSVMKPGQVLHRGQTFYGRIDVNEPSYVYVLLLGSSGSGATRLWPAAGAADELLPPSSIFTVPVGIEGIGAPEQKPGKVTEERVAYSVGGAPGTDTVLVISSHNQMANVFRESAVTDALFQKANTLLDQHQTIAGLEVEASSLISSAHFVDTNTAAGNLSQRNSVFLTRLKVRHD